MFRCPLRAAKTALNKVIHMPNKELRILVADPSLPRLIRIERCLNRLGYYRLLALQSSQDLQVMSHSLIDYFDVLIANQVLASSVKSTPSAQPQPAAGKTRPTLLYDWLHSPPDIELIERFMTEIDPPSPWACLKDLPWAKGAPRGSRQ
ncbi:hypothetical protein A2T76_07640 [Pseudomonas brenneri]|nr:hypothetical protein A2T76_07640 [Pseudomonas brenneri]